jgi:uncharacterized membrane protein YeaQ/YmgE (transglycosylase-associated protein family)
MNIIVSIIVGGVVGWLSLIMKTNAQMGSSPTSSWGSWER